MAITPSPHRGLTQRGFAVTLAALGTPQVLFTIPAGLEGVWLELHCTLADALVTVEGTSIVNIQQGLRIDDGGTYGPIACTVRVGLWLVNADAAKPRIVGNIGLRRR